MSDQIKALIEELRSEAEQWSWPLLTRAAEALAHMEGWSLPDEIEVYRTLRQTRPRSLINLARAVVASLPPSPTGGEE